MSGESTPRREPPPEAIREATQRPNGWVYEIVGGEAPDGSVPPERIRGAWKVDERGVIVGDFIPNARFEGGT